MLASLSWQVSQAYNLVEIESTATVATLRFSSKLGFSQVVLEGDSQVLMETLINDNVFLSSDGLLIDDIRLATRFFSQLHYSHVKREGNKVAHSLARHVLCISNFVVWMEDVPLPFLSIVLANIIGFS